MSCLASMGILRPIVPEGLVVRKARELRRAGFLNTNHANRRVSEYSDQAMEGPVNLAR